MDIISESTTEQNFAFVKQMRSKIIVGGEQIETDGLSLADDQSFSLSGWSKVPPIHSSQPQVFQIWKKTTATGGGLIVIGMHCFPLVNWQLIDGHAQAASS